MDKSFFEEYALITGISEFGIYKSAEDEANSIKKCTILKDVDISYSNEIIGYNNGLSYNAFG